MQSAKPMVVKLHEIPSGGLELSVDLSGSFAEKALSDTEADPRSARLSGSAFLLKTHRNVFVRGTIDGELAVPCSRCAKPARMDVHIPFRMTCAPRPEEGEAQDLPEELELSEEDVDFSTYTDERIDLTEIFREQLCLALPMTAYCREDCQGLCARCGNDLNEGPCACPQEPQGTKDERFSALRNLKV
jgi:uncharacterized protein